MVDILMIVLVSLAGLLALFLSIIFGPFGVLFWVILQKNAREAQERREVEDTLEAEVERQYEILRKASHRKIAEQDLQEPVAVNVDPYSEMHIEARCPDGHVWYQPYVRPKKVDIQCPTCAQDAKILCVRAPWAWNESTWWEKLLDKLSL